MIDLRFQPMTERVSDPLKRTRYRPVPFKAGAGYDDLERELRLLEATDIVIEGGFSRLQIRNDGWPRSSASPEHPDIRLFFKCKIGGKEATLKYECNAFADWQANLRAIGLWMQRQRLALQEWGIGAGGEAYRGFAALPGAIEAPEWYSPGAAVRFLIETATGKMPSEFDVATALKNPNVLQAWWKDAAKRAHPDTTGGDTELMAKVNRARDFIEKHAA